jgi:hypothetical protein
VNADYRFAVRFRLRPPEGITVDPAVYETAFRYTAPPPGEEGWLFFRDHLWHGEVNDPRHFRGLVENELGVPVDSVAFRAFETDEPYLEALRSAIAEELPTFRAESVDEVLNKYFASRIEVAPTE